MTRFIVSILHSILIFLIILIVSFSYYFFYSFYAFNPIYIFFIYELQLDIDPFSFGLFGALLGFVFSAIIFGPLFILFEINNTLKKSFKKLSRIEKNSVITDKEI